MLLVNSTPQVLLKKLMNRSQLTGLVNIQTSSGQNMIMLLLHLYTTLTVNRAVGDAHPLAEILSDPASAAVGFERKLYSNSI